MFCSCSLANSLTAMEYPGLLVAASCKLRHRPSQWRRGGCMVRGIFPLDTAASGPLYLCGRTSRN